MPRGALLEEIRIVTISSGQPPTRAKPVLIPEPTCSRLSLFFLLLQTIVPISMARRENCATSVLEVVDGIEEWGSRSGIRVSTPVLPVHHRYRPVEEADAQ